MQSAFTPPSPLADRYVIERELGRGGMATVWLARDTRDDRPVAIKVLNRELASVVGVGRFLREIQVTTALDHLNVVPVLDTGTLEGDGVDQPWYAMPFMAARRLSTGVEVSHADAFKALNLARSGDRRAARSAMQRAESLPVTFPTQGHTAVYLAHAYAALGEEAKALGWLRRYEVRRDQHFQMHLRCDPPFDVLANDPSFRALLASQRPPAGKGC